MARPPHGKDEDTSAPPKASEDEWEEYTQNTRLRMESQRIRAVATDVNQLQSRYQKLDRSVARIEEQLDNLAERVTSMPAKIGEVMGLKIETETQKLRLWVYSGIVATVVAVAITLLSIFLRR